jgi:hypothetical protein
MAFDSNCVKAMFLAAAEKSDAAARAAFLYKHCAGNAALR